MKKLKDFLLKYFERAIEIVSSEPSYDNEFCGFALEIEEQMAKEGIKKEAATRLFNPLYWRLALDELKKEKNKEFDRYVVVKEALFEHETDNKGTVKWKLKEKTKRMSKEEKEKLIEEIIKEHEEYYKANIEKFGLELAL